VVGALVVVGLSGCTADDAAGGSPPDVVPTDATAPGPAAQPPGPTSTAPVPAPVPAPEEPIPVARDDGYADAAATFGEAQVRQAVADHARIARIALADCHRWTTGETDPALAALLTPELLDRVEEELRRPPGRPPSLLSSLPDDDGNGHDLASAVRAGCDGSGPVRYDLGLRPNAVYVDRSGDEPLLVQVASYVVEVAFGDTVVGAGQDWVFTSAPTAGGWQLTDAEVSGHVNWFPATSG
jgi:hypothetical protein